MLKHSAYKRLYQEDGFSLIELLIGLSIFLVLLLPLSEIGTRALQNSVHSARQTDRLTRFAGTNNILTDYLPTARLPLLQSGDNQLEFQTTINGTPAYVRIWVDCTGTHKAIYYQVQRSAVNANMNPSFDSTTYTSTAVEANSTRTNPYTGSFAKWTAKVRGLTQADAAHPNLIPVRLPWITNPAYNATNPAPATNVGANYLHISPPDYDSYAFTGPSNPNPNRNSYTWLESDIIPASQGDTFLIGGYLRDTGTDTSATTAPRLEWYWVDRGTPSDDFNGTATGSANAYPSNATLSGERSGAIVAGQNGASRTSMSSYYTATTLAAPPGTDGIVLRFSPGLATRYPDGADLDGVMVQRINGRLTPTAAGTYFDGNTAAPTSDLYKSTDHGTSGTTYWAGVPNQSVSVYGVGTTLGPKVATWPNTDNTVALNTAQQQELVPLDDSSCAGGKLVNNNGTVYPLFQYLDSAGNTLASASTASQINTRQLKINIPVLKSANGTAPYLVHMNGFHNAVTLSQIPTLFTLSTSTGIPTDTSITFPGGDLAISGFVTGTAPSCKIELLNSASTVLETVTVGDTHNSFGHRYSFVKATNASASYRWRMTQTGSGICSLTKPGGFYAP